MKGASVKGVESGRAVARVLRAAELVDRPTSWPVTATRVLGEGQITALRQDDVQAPDGESMQREYLQHPGAVAVIALDEQEQVVLVQQYRHAVRHRLLEPPAGLLDVSGENPLAAARRELAEEVNLVADRWAVLVDVFSTPGIIGEPVRIFLARDLHDVASPEGFTRAGEEAEMETVRAALEDLVDAVLAGRVHNPNLVNGVLAAALSRDRDGFASLRPAEVGWPARDVLLDTAERA